MNIPPRDLSSLQLHTRVTWLHNRALLLRRARQREVVVKIRRRAHVHVYEQPRVVERVLDVRIRGRVLVQQ